MLLFLKEEHRTRQKDGQGDARKDPWQTKEPDPIGSFPGPKESLPFALVTREGSLSDFNTG